MEELRLVGRHEVIGRDYPGGVCRRRGQLLERHRNRRRDLEHPGRRLRVRRQRLVAVVVRRLVPERRQAPAPHAAHHGVDRLVGAADVHATKREVPAAARVERVEGQRLDDVGVVEVAVFGELARVGVVVDLRHALRHAAGHGHGRRRLGRRRLGKARGGDAHRQYGEDLLHGGLRYLVSFAPDGWFDPCTLVWQFEQPDPYGLLTRL